MNRLFEKSDAMAVKAHRVIEESGIVNIWHKHGAKVNIIGSLAMGLIINHRDIDLHVYTCGITEAKSFAIVSEIAASPNVVEIKCINGLHTDEHCIAWHISYKSHDGEMWKFDIIHIEKGTHYDGFFEAMAENIKRKLAPDTRATILRLKEQTPEDKIISGVEYYQAVLEDNVTTLDELYNWVDTHRANPKGEYWMPD